MNWNYLNSDILFNELLDNSNLTKHIIFKYSPNCSINILIRSLFERECNLQLLKNIPIFLLNVAENKILSERISQELDVKHETPQLLVIENGRCIHSFSYGKIRFEELVKLLNL